jgi:ubiquinone/menaquinone biosynthesis C-methylase UbiE
MSDGKFSFDASYTDYWQNIQQSSGTGDKRRLEVPSEEIVDYYLSVLNIKRSDKLLDLGCSYGRLFTAINKYCDTIYGIDVDLETINKALVFNYTCLVRGQSEDTHFASNLFDKIFCWAVFDVVEQELSLLEANRILKTGGKLLITGKNASYRSDDKNAFIAERNAKLKNFPNHFTDVYKLILNIEKFGFKIVNALGFENRGDFASKHHFQLDVEHPIDFYEYVIIFEKTGLPKDESKSIKFGHEFSHTATKMCSDAKQTKMLDFFALHKSSFGN